jgi:hypothetical protein
VSAFDLIAERRIQEALARGEFDNLPGAGRPLELDDEPLVPEEVRAIYRVLKNAGFVPPEVEALRTPRREAALGGLGARREAGLGVPTARVLATSETPLFKHTLALRKLELLRLNAPGHRPYAEKLLRRLSSN